MDKSKISRITKERIFVLRFKKDNIEIIDQLVESSKNEEELILKLKEAFPNYEDIHYVLYDGILPNGQPIGGPAYLGAGVPEECPFTPEAYARNWQKRINRSPKLRKELGIKVLDEKCPYCKGRMFAYKNYKWCNGYPDCEYGSFLEQKNAQ